MTSLFSGVFDEDIKKGEKVLDYCKTLAKTKAQVLQGKGPLGEGSSEEEEEERRIWASTEDFVLENHTTAFSNEPTPRYRVLFLTVRTQKFLSVRLHK